MRATFLPALCALTSAGFVACQAATVQFGDTGRPPRPDSADTAVDSGGENGGNGGNGGETGTGGDTGSSTSSFYTGDVSGRLTYSDGDESDQVECSGTTTFSVSADGTLTGTATCGAGPQSVSGPLEGSVTGANIRASWSVQLGAEAFTVPLAGVLTGTEITLHGEGSLGDVGTFSVNITASQ